MIAETTDTEPGHCSAASDLDLLARWATVLYGRGLPIEPTIRSDAARVGPEDERTREWHRAMAVHRRFERLRTGAGRRHYAVLEWVYLDRGPEARAAWGGLMSELGWAFATREQREVWGGKGQKRRSVHVAAVRLHGERLYDAAVAAYAAG